MEDSSLNASSETPLSPGETRLQAAEGGTQDQSVSSMSCESAGPETPSSVQAPSVTGTHSNTINTTPENTSDDPSTSETHKVDGLGGSCVGRSCEASRSEDSNTVETPCEDASGDKDTVNKEHQESPADDMNNSAKDSGSSQTRDELLGEDCGQEITVSNDNPTNATDGTLISSQDSSPNVTGNSGDVTASESDPTDQASVTEDPTADVTTDNHKMNHQTVLSSLRKDRSDSVEESRYYITEDEGSDWEGPVDVELEETPLVLKRHPGKASWSTVKALTRWMPVSRPKHRWTQMAGHQGSFLAGTAGTILKLLVPREEKNLKLLMAETSLKQHVPQYHGTVDKDGESYVQLQDLLCEFNSPCVMDIKMGVRTYLEEELEKARKKPTLRKDLYEKMVSIDTKAPTEEERQESAITKPRYMKFRDDMSSTSSLGFRIEGIKTLNGASKDYKNTRTRDDVREALAAFVGDSTTVLEKYISSLSEIGKAQDSSNFFQSHEMVGSSLLFVHDGSGRAGVWMIDFAKCCRLPTIVAVDHRSPWTPGNYEDGYLFGVDNLKSIFQELEAAQKSD